MAPNFPLTVQCSVSANMDNRISIGPNKLFLSCATTNLYWAVVVDRTNLNVVANFNFSNNSNVPPQLAPYQGNAQYMLILSTMRVLSTNLPVGNFYNFLVASGAGKELQRIEQIYAALNCSNWGNMGYVLVTILDNTPVGIDYSAYNDSAFVCTLQLVPTQVGPGVLYTPEKY